MDDKPNTFKEEERTRQIFELRKESELLFDKQLRYISSGAIALSVTLIASNREIELNWMLLTAWILLIVTLLLNMVSYKVAVKALDFDAVEHPEYSEDNKCNAWTEGLNWTSLGTLALGLLFLVLFFFKI
ncbi:MAG: hypothetical protein K6F40_03100 [Bacteroidales bacterium]|nr:hypothetical protein [Bacteroidales bacterium]